MTYVGKTALITGASSGIGLEYARAFAARGCHLVLVARRAEALAAIAAELTTRFGVSVSTISLDLSDSDSAQKLAAHVGDSPIDILINNAGFGTNARFEDEDLDRVRDEITLNVSTLTELTGVYLPSMLKRNDGVIINIASTAAFQPVPGMAVYAATKAYVLSFTRALWEEVRGTGVRVLAVCPGATDTEFFHVAGASPSTGLAPISDVIDQTFTALATNTPSVVVGSRNRVMAFAGRFVPVTAVMKVAAAMFLPPKR